MDLLAVDTSTASSTARRYVDMLPPTGPARAFCATPLARARAAVERLRTYATA